MNLVIKHQLLSWHYPFEVGDLIYYPSAFDNHRYYYTITAIDHERYEMKCIFQDDPEDSVTDAISPTISPFRIFQHELCYYKKSF